MDFRLRETEGCGIHRPVCALTGGADAWGGPRLAQCMGDACLTLPPPCEGHRGTGVDRPLSEKNLLSRRGLALSLGVPAAGLTWRVSFGLWPRPTALQKSVSHNRETGASKGLCPLLRARSGQGSARARGRLLPPVGAPIGSVAEGSSTFTRSKAAPPSAAPGQWANTGLIRPQMRSPAPGRRGNL